MSDFIWIPNSQTTADRVYRTLDANLGDGYRQVAQDGINNVNEEWSLTFSPIPSATYAAILAFLDARAGAQYFTWTPLSSAGDNVELYVRCSELRKTLNENDERGLMLTFVRAFIP